MPVFEFVLVLMSMLLLLSFLRDSFLTLFLADIFGMYTHGVFILVSLEGLKASVSKLEQGMQTCAALLQSAPENAILSDSLQVITYTLSTHIKKCTLTDTNV